MTNRRFASAATTVLMLALGACNPGNESADNSSRNVVSGNAAVATTVDKSAPDPSSVQAFSPRQDQLAVEQDRLQAVIEAKLNTAPRARSAPRSPDDDTVNFDSGLARLHERSAAAIGAIDICIYYSARTALSQGVRSKAAIGQFSLRCVDPSLYRDTDLPLLAALSLTPAELAPYAKLKSAEDANEIAAGGQ